MDLDSRSRMTSGRSGRIILLGDGTEVLTDSGDHDADMFDQSDEEDKDLENEVQKGQAQATQDRSQRGETPGPDGESSSSEPFADVHNKAGTGPGSTPDEPKMMVPTDNASNEEIKEQVNASKSQQS